MLTASNLGSLDASNRAALLADQPPPRKAKKEITVRIYEDELERPKNLDLGLKGVSRAQLRAWVKECILEASVVKRRKYSHSALSSALSGIDTTGNAKNALKQLQKERLIVSRMGFPDRAMEIDAEIDRMLTKVKQVRDQEEKDLLDYRLKMLAAAQGRKRAKMEAEIAEEFNTLEETLKHEYIKVRKRQKEEFMRLMENTSRRAIGKAKKCNCTEPYLCSHNKVASYNTRRPSKTVVQYRRNGKRLRQSGRPEEGAAWEEKAADIDFDAQEEWRVHIASSIVASPWGANEAFVDQYAERHKKELDVLQKTHDVKRAVLNAETELKRRNFENTCDAEERKVKMQCRKQAAMRSRADAAEQAREDAKLDQLGEKSDGLKNVSANLLAMMQGKAVDDGGAAAAAIDWTPPTTFGVDNSVRLIDAYKDTLAKKGAEGIDDSAGGVQRILRSKNDMKKGMTAEDAALGEEEDDDDDEAFEGLLEGDEAMEAYKFGETSGSKLVDRMRKKEEREKRLSSDALNELAGSGASLNKMAASNNSLNQMAGGGSSNSLEAMATGMGAPAYGWGSPPPAASPWGAAGATGASGSFGSLGAFGSSGGDGDGDAANRGPLSPTAPSMPLPSSPSFQAQSRRPSNRPASDAAATNALEADEEDDDRKVPAFAPGSTRDEDWRERDAAAAKGFGMENSYGAGQAGQADGADGDGKHEPDPTAAPGRSALGGSKRSSGGTSGGGGGGGGVSFGAPTVHEYEVDEDENKKKKGWGNFLTEIHSLYDDKDAPSKGGAAATGAAAAKKKPAAPSQGKKGADADGLAGPMAGLSLSSSSTAAAVGSRPSADDGGDDEEDAAPAVRLTPSALAALAAKTAPDEDDDSNDDDALGGGDDELADYERELRKEVSVLRKELLERISRSNSSNGSNASGERARAIASKPVVPPGVAAGKKAAAPAPDNNNDDEEEEVDEEEEDDD